MTMTSCADRGGGTIISRRYAYPLLVLLSIWSSSSSTGCHVSGEIFPSLRQHHHYLQASPPPSLNRIHTLRRNRRRWGVRNVQTIPSGSSTTDILLDLRCGAAADEQCNPDEYESVVVETQPMMDLTIAGSGDTSTTGVDVMSTTNNEPDPGLDCVQQKVDDKIDDKNNDSDCTESVINDNEIMGNSIDTEDMPPLDVNSEGSVIGDVMPGFDEPEISTIPSDLSTSPQMSSHDADSHDMQKQNHLDLLSSASDQRAEGKTLHDSGNLADAALAFQKAALLLDEAITISINFSEDEASDIDFDAISVERATCRLHEALCLFKDGRPGECIEACTDVLEDGVSVISLEEEVGNDDTETSDSNDTSKRNNVGSVKVITSPVRNNENVDSRTRRAVPPQIRARAFHRRAKARLALDDLDGALEDARSAAFMGDRNAVQFYGRLMREGSGAGATASGVGSLAPLGGLGAANPLTTNPFLEGILGGIGGNGNNPFMPVGAGSSDFSSSLLSTLLSSGNGSSSGGGSGGGSPLLGLMGDLLSPQPMVSGKRSGRGSRGKSKKGGGADSLAKSILTSLMKRIEDEDTQSTICKYLHSTNTQQVMQYATMAGIPMKEGSARRLVSFANGVTPKGIRKSISNVKRGISVIKTLRKIFKVIEKYKYIIILTVTCYWIRSAIVEPYPVRRSKKQAQELTQKAALSFILPSRGVRGSLITLTSGVVDSLSRSFLVMEDKFAEDDESTELEELNYLQNQLSLIEAIERNEAQLDSFVDSEDQWNSLEEDEKLLLRNKNSICKRIDLLAKVIDDRRNKSVTMHLRR